MLTPRGRLYGDLTLACLAQDHYLVLGSGATQDMHRRWFERHLPATGVSYRNVSDALHGVAIAGPRSRGVLARLVREDVSSTALKFRDVRRTFVAGVPATLVRLSFSGELGYEIYCEPQYQLALWERIAAAGEEFGIRPYGARALMSLRLEKHWGVWTLDYRPDYTAAESGLDAFIDWRRDFIGREAVVAERERTPLRKLVTMVIEGADRDVVGDEAILHDGQCIGHVTSGGYAHHVGCSMALGYVATTHAADGSAVEVEINGVACPARVQSVPPYDPTGARMRS
jgi:dimethylglycine dehydrogenase